jgi:hypothetical protein
MTSSVPPALLAQAQKGWFYADERNQPVGPLPFSALQALAASGVILPATFVLLEGESEWRKYGDVASISAIAGVASNDTASTPSGPETRKRAASVLLVKADALRRHFVRLSDRLPAKWRKPVAIAGIALLAFSVLAPFRLATRSEARATLHTLDNESFDGVVLRGNAFYADEQAYRETTLDWRDDHYPTLPTPKPSTGGRIELYESKPEDGATTKERERSEVAWEQFKAQGRVWSESFDVPVRKVREKQNFGAVLVEPAKGFAMRRAQFWVSKSTFFPRSHPVAKGWASKRFVRQSELQFVFNGSNRTRIGRVYVENASDMLTGIVDGAINADEAKHYAFTEAVVSASVVAVLDNYLIYEARVSPRTTTEFALRRNRTIEAARNGISESELDSRNDLFNGYDPLLGGPVVFCGREQFTTRSGFVKNLPVLEIVNLVP